MANSRRERHQVAAVRPSIHTTHLVPDYEATTERAAQIGGNASVEVRQHILAMLCSFMKKGWGFADAVGGRIKIVEIEIRRKEEEPEKMEARVVCEAWVEEDMLNGGGTMHGACSAYLIDVCSSLPISALDLATGGPGSGGVSQSISTVLHSPAVLGDKLRIVSTTLTLGSRALSSRCEIWNVTKHRLVSSGVHIKMEPSAPKSSMAKL